MIKKIALCLALILPSASFATYQEPIPIPEIEVGGSDDGAAILLAIGILGFILWHSLEDDTPEDLSTPRPTVRPDACLNKDGQTVACE
jgi:hypothetical protein